MGRSYDAARGWMTNSTVAGGYMNMSYSYNANGQVTSITDSVTSGQSVTSYAYDNLNRLSSATATNWNMAWTFDDFGNRLTQTGSTGVPTSSLTYNNATNRITNSGYSYDANGNLTGMPSYVTLSYDAFDRLSTRSSTSYGYDAFGRRVARDYNGSTRIYFYSITGQLLAEYNYAENNSCGTDSDGDPIPCPILSPGTPTSTTQYFAGQRVGQWTDRVGSKRRDASTTSHYYPYGEEITGTANDTHKYAQTYRDSDSGLDYAGARYYASGIGRFLTPDPAGKNVAEPASPATWNAYAYVNGNPVNSRDPVGLGACPLDNNGDDPCGGGDFLYGGGGGGGACLLDGEQVSCEVVQRLQSMGVALTLGQYNAWALAMADESTLNQAKQAAANAQTTSQLQAVFSQYLSSFQGLGLTTDQIAGALSALVPDDLVGGHFNLTLNQQDLTKWVGADIANQILGFAQYQSGLPGDNGTRYDLGNGLTYHLTTAGSDLTMHFDLFNPLQSDLMSVFGHIIVEVVGGHLPGVCLDPACHP